MKSSLAALLTGILVSLGLFWLMQLMLMTDRQAVKQNEHLNTVEFVRIKREPPKPKIEKKPEKQVEQVQQAKPQTQKPQKTPPKRRPDVKKAAVKQETPKVVVPKLDIPVLPVPPVKSDAPVVNAPKAAETADNSVKSGKSADSSGRVSSGVVPLERVPPKYPLRAVNRRIEGWVKIEFTITEEGNVENAVVVEAQPTDIFNDAALTAIRKWKFKEKIVDGVALTQRAVQTLQFKLAK